MNTKRINRIEGGLQERKAAARAEWKKWWDQFSEAELQRIVDGDEDMIKRIYTLGYERINELARYALTDEEKKELRKIEKELQSRSV